MRRLNSLILLSVIWSFSYFAHADAKVRYARGCELSSGNIVTEREATLEKATRNCLRGPHGTPTWIRAETCVPGMQFCDCGNYNTSPEGWDLGKKWELCSGYVVEFKPGGSGGIFTVANQSKQLIYSSNVEGKSLEINGGKDGTRLVFQNDGNLVIYTAHGVPVWSTETYNHPGALLVIQEDGNVVIYPPNFNPLKDKALWKTDTNGKWHL